MSRMVSLIVLAVLVIIAGILFYKVMINYFVPVFIAVVLTIIFKPVHLWIVRLCRGRDRLAAGLTTAAILLIVLLPLGLIIWKATVEAISLLPAHTLIPTASLDPAGDGQPDLDDKSGGPEAKPATDPVVAAMERAAKKTQKVDLNDDVQSVWQPVKDLVTQINHRFGWKLDPDGVVKQLQVKLYSFASASPGVLGDIVFGMLVLVFSLYYFLADGEEMIQSMIQMFPLKSGYQMQLLGEFQRVSRAIVVATLLSALCQGILAGIGFTVAGMPSVFLLMLLTMLMSMVPLVGSMSVWGGSALYLYFSGHEFAGIALAIYGVSIISMVDNIIKPLVLQGQSSLHPLWALLSVLGGMAALGGIGVFVGPLIVAFLQAGLKMFQQELTTFDQRAKVSSMSGV